MDNNFETLLLFYLNHSQNMQQGIGFLRQFSYVMFCAVWYYLYYLKNVKNTHWGVLLLVKLPVFSLQLY